MRKTIYTLIISISLQLAVCSLTYAQPGSLDLTFSGDGKATTSFSSVSSSGKAMVIQPDGKIVGAGRMGSSSNSSGIDFALARYKTNGDLDSTFGVNGRVNTNIGNSNYDNIINAIAIQPDGKLVVAGETEQSTPGYAFVVARYNTNGTLDSSFGTNGSVVQSVSLIAQNIGAKTVLIQPDGKIVLGGTAYNSVSNGYDFALVRYNSTGTLDTSFDADGILTVDIAGLNDECFLLAIQPDGKIVASGYGTLVGTNRDFAVMRFNPNGSLDNTFDSNGIVTTDFTTNFEFGFSVALDSQNKIIVGGSGSNFFAVARYNTNGSLDNSFSFDGIQTTSLVNSARGLVIQNDDKIVMAGRTDQSPGDFAIVRYTTNGSLDPTFDVDGIVTTDFSGQLDAVYDAAIQTDGKIVVFGESHPITSIVNFAVARYNGNCASSVTFSQSPVICFGQGFTVGANTYYTGGTYIDTLATTTGCDSIVTTNLTVNFSSSNYQILAICDGQSITVGSNTYSVQGIYYDTLVSANGCDSTIMTELYVNPNSAFTQTLTINSGDSVVVGNSVYNATGVYIDTLVAANGCDSVVTTNLTVITSINENNYQLIQLVVSPNPSVGWFEVSGLRFQSGDIVILSDMVGKPILTKIISEPADKFKLQTSALNTGMYFLTVKVTSGVTGRKVVVER